MTEDSAVYVARHRAGLAKKGLVRVEVSIPAEKRAELKRLEKAWRAEAAERKE